MNYKEILKKAVSVTTSVATVVVLSGVLAVAPAQAANESSVGDVTGSDPRIAADGESERVVLGLNMIRDDNTDDITLDALRVTLEAVNTANVSGDEREATLAAIEEVRLYKDSSLSGTNGVFDSADSLVHSVKRATVVRTTVAATQTAGATTLQVASTANISANDEVRIGTGATAEIRTVSSIGGVNTDTLVFAASDGLTYAHNTGEEVNEVLVSNVAANTEGFQEATSGANLVVELGDFDNSAQDIDESIAKNDTGNNAGHDFFVVLLTKDGVANMEVKAQVFTGDVQYRNDTGSGTNITAAVSSESGTTDGKTKAVTFGADNVDPTILSVTSKDTDANGQVDQFVVLFSESMSTSVTDTDNFVNAATSGTLSQIEAGAVDIILEDNGTWSTTNVTNDTFTMDVTNQGAFTGHEFSTGDTWTVIYDVDASANDFKDATGEKLEDASITSTDGAAPTVDPVDINGGNSATLHDLDGDGQVDELRVTASESLSANSTHAGWTLKNTTKSPDVTYTISGVAGFTKSTNGSDGSGANANDNDTIRLTVTESGSNDVNDTFTLAYTKQSSGGILDAAGNTAPTDSSVSLGTGLTPVATKAEFKDGGPNGQLDKVEVTFTCNVTNEGDAYKDFTVSGYTITTSSASNKVLTLTLTEKTVVDTGKTPDVTYTEDGDTDRIHCGDTNFLLQNINSGDLTETDKASPVVMSAKLYESTNDNIWKNGETLQVLLSEAPDASTVSTSWNTTGADGDVFTDWSLQDSGGTKLGDAKIPDSGTISVSGRVVTLTATADASSALSSTDQVKFATNEVKDAAGNSGVATSVDANDDIDVDPTSAPSVSLIETKDADGNGILDSFHIHFDGLIDASTIVASDFAAARGANFTIANDAAESATSDSAVSPDLTITSVTTASGGNDTVVVVKYTEANEGTGEHPQVKYVKGSLKDLAGNEVSTFNANSSDNTKFQTTITNDAVDAAAPIVVHKLLKDRNSNGIYDQLLIVFSEGIDNNATADDALANGSHTASGWKVENHNIASSGALSDNDGTFDAYTFSSTNAVFKVDILEGSAPTSLPEVTYSSTGNFKDKHHNTVLGDVAAGGEVSEIPFTSPPAFADGDLVREAGNDDVYIVSLVGSKKFKRLILNPDIFNSYGHLEWANVQDVAAGTLDSYTLSELVMEVNPDGSAVNGKVYQVSSSPGADDGTKRHLNMTPAEFEACGYDWDAIAKINHTEASETFHPTGVDITSC